VSNLPNGVCAHPTMLAVMVFLPLLLQESGFLQGSGCRKDQAANLPPNSSSM
jgi:hypothetical protein